MGITLTKSWDVVIAELSLKTGRRVQSRAAILRLISEFRKRATEFELYPETHHATLNLYDERSYDATTRLRQLSIRWNVKRRAYIVRYFLCGLGNHPGEFAQWSMPDRRVTQFLLDILHNLHWRRRTVETLEPITREPRIGSTSSDDVLGDDMSLSTIEQVLLLAAYFRGNPPGQIGWISSCDQVVTLSLFYTGDISHADCVERFSRKSYISSLYDDEGELLDKIRARYRVLINLIRTHPQLIQGGGDLDLPANPTFTACRLTPAGDALVPSLISLFPAKPDFPNWPDERTFA